MKSKLLVVSLVFTSVMPALAFSINGESCWSAAPILKSTAESKKIKDEKKLCAMDFYNDKFSICPKLNSTFPGVLIVKRPEQITDEAFRHSYCGKLDSAKKSLGAKVVAKFKQTTSCSHTSSGVAYYRIAEFLGGSRVPVTVFRTMDRSKHLEISQQAEQLLSGSKELIAQNWKRFLQMHAAPEKYPHVFTQDGSMVYGALSENVTGEFKYTEVSGVGSYDSRYQRFQKQQPFLNVVSTASVAAIAGGTSFKHLAPVASQMKDVSNMIIIDHILNQADRIGNIHFKYKWYKYDQGNIDESSSEAEYVNRKDVIPADELVRAKNGEVLVKEMILKDNDCGISKDNEMKKIGALAKLRHMNPKVYQQVQKLAAYVSTEEGMQYFKNELRIPNESMVGNKYISSINNNIIEVARTLKANCDSGALSLDLDLEQLMVNPNFKASCTVM